MLGKVRYNVAYENCSQGIQHYSDVELATEGRVQRLWSLHDRGNIAKHNAWTDDFTQYRHADILMCGTRVQARWDNSWFLGVVQDRSFERGTIWYKVDFSDWDFWVVRPLLVKSACIEYLSEVWWQACLDTKRARRWARRQARSCP